MNEHDLVEQLKAGVPHAQREFQQRYGQEMIGILWRVTRDSEVAQELWGEAQLHVWQKVNTFILRGEGSFSAWVRRVVINLAKNELRRQRRSPQELPLTPQVETIAVPTDTSTGAEAEAVSSLEVKIFREAFRLLPERYQEMLLLRTTLCEPIEIAHLTGDQPATVRVKLNQAAKLLLRRLTEHPQFASLSVDLPTHTQLLKDLKSNALNGRSPIIMETTP